VLIAIETTDMSRSVIALYAVSFFFLFLSFFTGIAGCWKRSHANLVATGVLQLLACKYQSPITDHHHYLDPLSNQKINQLSAPNRFRQL
jgi:hypothetical protein